MQILAIERGISGVQASAFTAPLLQAEAEHLWRLYQDGVVRQQYFRADRHEAVLVLEADSPEMGRAVLATLPLVSAGLIDFEIIPLRAYPGFARLFENVDSI